MPAPPEARVLEPSRGLCTVARSFTVEDAEIRAAEEGSTVRQFIGHASVTNEPYDIFGGPDAGGFTETIERGAFKRALGRNPDVPLLINHEGQPYAATWNGTISLSEDDTGLRVEALIDTEYPDAQSFVRRLETGLLREMSFAFRVTQQEWRNADGEVVPWWDLSGVDRRIQAVDIHKGDVSVVNFGANPATDAALRSLTDVLRSIQPSELDPGDLRDAITYLRQMMDVNGDPCAELCTALDTLLEGAATSLVSVDTSTWPAEAQSLLSTVVAADALVDQMMAVLAIPDPDENDEEGNPLADLGTNPDPSAMQVPVIMTSHATTGKFTLTGGWGSSSSTNLLTWEQPTESAAHPDVVAAQLRGAKRHNELVAALLQ